MKSVLVIEDNPDNLRLISYALKRSGLTVISAESGELGIELALRERPDFIIMDIMLPGIDGIETTKRIRASELDGLIPIIAMTSYAMRGDREIILAAGCNGYIEKPIDPLTVVDQLQAIIKDSAH
jgi:two-component system cell cycle response regulator DivK